jgi:ligand-binding SRPBCC domain-containing protein
MRRVVRESTVDRPLEEVFAFFSKAENLNQLTPEKLHFKILTPLPIKMGKDTLIDYKIRLGGVTFKWRTEITEWEPPYRFVDVQLKGPYKVWIHEHLFKANGSGTTMIDTVDYLLKGWFLEPVIHKLFVKKKLEEILDYRENKLKLIFKDDNTTNKS